MAEQWKRQGLPGFLALARRTWEDIQEAPAHLPFTNWYAAITARSHAAVEVSPGTPQLLSGLRVDTAIAAA